MPSVEFQKTCVCPFVLDKRDRTCRFCKNYFLQFLQDLVHKFASRTMILFSLSDVSIPPRVRNSPVSTSCLFRIRASSNSFTDSAHPARPRGPFFGTKRKTRKKEREIEGVSHMKDGGAAAGGDDDDLID